MFIYGLIDPNDGTLRYVGQTKSPKERLWGHMGMAPRMRRSQKAKPFTPEKAAILARARLASPVGKSK